MSKDPERKFYRQAYTPERQAMKKARYLKNKELIVKLKEEKGNKCEECGATGRLEFDHRDRRTKTFTLAKACLRSEATIRAEADKCRLLCRKCHWKRTQRQHTDGDIKRRKHFDDPPTGSLRRCNRCCVVKDFCEYHKDKRATDGRQHVCKECERVRMRDYHKANRLYIESCKTACVVCGATSSLEFDHVRGKKFKNVSMMKSYTRTKIDAEIAKCEVLCTTCHMAKTEREAPGKHGRPRGSFKRQDVRAGVAER